MVEAYDVKMECRTGTQRVVHDTAGCRWEDCWHVITWCREYSLEDAVEAVRSLSDDNPQVRGVWFEPVAT